MTVNEISVDTLFIQCRGNFFERLLSDGLYFAFLMTLWQLQDRQVLAKCECRLAEDNVLTTKPFPCTIRKINVLIRWFWHIYSTLFDRLQPQTVETYLTDFPLAPLCSFYGNHKTDVFIEAQC